MKHAFQSTVPDSGSAALVRPSNWNDTHIDAITTTSTNLLINATDDFIYATGGSGGITLSLPGANTLSTGRGFYFQKADGGVGVVSIAPNGGDTIAQEASTYSLEVQNQYVRLVTDGVSNWIIKYYN